MEINVVTIPNKLHDAGRLLLDPPINLHQIKLWFTAVRKRPWPSSSCPTSTELLILRSCPGTRRGCGDDYYRCLMVITPVLNLYNHDWWSALVLQLVWRCLSEYSSPGTISYSVCWWGTHRRLGVPEVKLHIVFSWIVLADVQQRMMSFVRIWLLRKQSWCFSAKRQSLEIWDLLSTLPLQLYSWCRNNDLILYYILYVSMTGLCTLWRFNILYKYNY